MAIRSGSIRKKCYCKDESGRRLGARCSRLKLASGAWSSGHGVWAFQIELPPRPGAGGGSCAACRTRSQAPGRTWQRNWRGCVS